MRHPSTNPLARAYNLLDEYEIATTEELERLPESKEIDFIRCFTDAWQGGFVDRIRLSPTRKFALHVDTFVTSRVVAQAALYGNFTFLLTPPICARLVSQVRERRTARAHAGSEWKVLKRHLVPRTFVRTLLKARKLVESGGAVVIPHRIDAYNANGKPLQLTWPDASHYKTIDVSLTRVRSTVPWLYNDADSSGDVVLQVPAFVNTPLDDILRIRHDYEAAFSRFTKRFFEMVKPHESVLGSERAIRTAIEEVDDAVSSLDAKLCNLKRTRNFSTSEAILSASACCLMLVAPPEIASVAATLFAGHIGSTILRNFSALRSQKDEITSHDFFVPWSLARNAAKPKSI